MIQKRFVTVFTAALALCGCGVLDTDGAGQRSDMPTPPVSTPAGPPKDADADGVPDAGDRCGGTLAGRPVDADGCDLLDGVAEGVTFRSGSDTLTAEAESVLVDIALALREHPTFNVVIAAHTDNRGPAESNLELSRRRALAVARYLAGEGVEPSRLKPQAYGESRPLVSNASAAGRASNRRVEFSIVEQE